jgi:long-chain acyl-CoA synthetase
VKHVHTLAQLLHARAAATPDSAAVRVKGRGGWTDRSWRQLAERVDRIAAGLLSALELGDHDVVCLLGQTSEAWLAADYAALSVGLQTVPIYASLHAEEVGYAHVDTGIRLVIVDDAAQLAKVRAMRDGFTFFDVAYGADEIRLERIVVIDPTDIAPADDWESLEDLEMRGASRLEASRAELERRRASASAHQTATYTYTSGTTGPPKAVVQTHDNHLAMVRAVAEAGVIGDEMREGGLFLFLPLAHSFGRLIQFAAPFFDLPMVLSSVPTLAEDVRTSRPGFFPSAPRVYEKMKAKIDVAVEAAPWPRRALARWALRTGAATVPYTTRGAPLPAGLALRHRVADRLVLSKLRARLGLDRASALLSGSAPLDAEVETFFLACGLTLLEAYGLTEICPGLAANRPGAIRVGTVGRALPGVSLKLAADGEILARGPNITEGYLNRPDATAGAFDEDGWFCTGDLGSLTADGFLRITGRKKELIKTSGGKYVAPSKIEGRLKSHPVVGEALVVGDRRNYCVALLALDVDALPEWAASQGLEPEGPGVLAAVEAHLTEVNAGLASFETVKRVRVTPEAWTVDNGALTASLKVKRGVVEARYADLIEAMYAQTR